MQTLSSNSRWPRYLVWIASALAAFLYLLLPTASRRNLFIPLGAPFCDVVVYKGRFTLYHSAKFFNPHNFSAFAYPAAAAPVYELLYKTSHPVLTFQLFCFFITLAALAAAYLFLRRRNALDLMAPLLLLNFPLVFAIRQGNIEIALWVIIALGILAYRRGFGVVSATLFGIAAAIKLYPIFLLGLFFKRRREVPLCAVGIGVFLLTTFFAIAYAGPTVSIAANGFFTGVNRFQEHYIDSVSVTEVMFDHCLFSPFKYLAYLQEAHHLRVDIAHWRLLYYLIAGPVALLLFVRVRTFPFLNRVLFLVTAMVSLPPVSFTYTFLHLYVPMFFLLGALLAHRGRPPATMLAAFALLLLLMLPFVGLSLFGVVTGPAQSLLLFALLILCVLTPWPSDSIARD